MLKTISLFLCLATVSFASCTDNDDDDTNNNGQNPATSELSVTPGDLSFVAAGETKTVAVKAKNVVWQATTTAKWLTLSDYEGAADGTVSVKAEANPEQAERKTTITVSGEGVEPVTIEVSQAAATETEPSEPQVSASVKKLSFTSGNYYSKVFMVEANVDWVADTESDWIILDQQMEEESHNGMVTVSVVKNTKSKRDGVISLKVGEKTIVSIPVTQKEVFSSDLIGLYKPFVADPENPIAEFFITPTYPEGTEEPEVDVSFIFGPGAMWPVSVVTSLANQMVGMLYAGGLDHFEFKDDGTFSAGYRNLLGFDMSNGPTYSEEMFTYPSAETLEMIPADAISYYTENSKVYFAINKEYLSQIGQSELETDLTVLIEALLEQYPEIGNSIVSNDEIFALPLNYLFEGGKLKLWVDREMMMPFIPLLSELVETMLPEEITVQMDPNDPQTAMTIPVKNLLGQLLEGLFTKTESLEIGISLAKQ